MKKIPCLLLLAFFPWLAASAAIDNKLRIGVLAFGTVNWELAAMRTQGLDTKYGLDLAVQPLASPEAGKIGLQADSLDMIVTDWIWVAHQQQARSQFRFIPYSTHAGALIAPQGSNIQTVADLVGKKLGIVGSGLDKNWLLLRAYARKVHGIDLDKAVEKVFGAPPLLNQQLADGKLDALLNFWHYAAKQEAQGYRRVLDGRDVLKGLGIEEPLPNLGYVFKQSWGSTHLGALSAFRKASEEARALLCENDAAWNKIAPLTQEKEEKLRAVLRREYCAGVVRKWGPEEIRSVGKIYTILRETGGEQITGKAERLPEEIFWKE
ncbi:MAG: transporter substrate-binding protein [Proteobacteria bacterium]|nr:transporter substrate-binding protein [Pseudomonadota bacterium]